MAPCHQRSTISGSRLLVRLSHTGPPHAQALPWTHRQSDVCTFRGGGFRVHTDERIKRAGSFHSQPAEEDVPLHQALSSSCAKCSRGTSSPAARSGCHLHVSSDPGLGLCRKRENDLAGNLDHCFIAYVCMDQPNSRVGGGQKRPCCGLALA